MSAFKCYRRPRTSMPRLDQEFEEKFRDPHQAGYGASLASFYTSSFTLSCLIGAVSRQEASTQFSLAKSRHPGFFALSRFQCEGYKSDEEMRMQKFSKELRQMQARATSFQKTNRHGGFNRPQYGRKSGAPRGRGYQGSSRGEKRPRKDEKGSGYWLAGSTNM